MDRFESTTRLMVWAASLFSLLFVAPSLAQSGDNDAIARIGGQLLAGGGNYRVDEDVADNAFIVGGRVLVNGNYGANLYLVGGDTEFEGTARGDLFIAGGILDIVGGVGDNAYIAGGTVRQRTDSVIAGDAFLTGGAVELNGVIGGDLYAEARTVRLNGEVAGDVQVEAGRVILGPSALIGGALTYRSDKALDLDPDAVVAGTITHKKIDKGARFVIPNRVGIGILPPLIALALMAALLHLVMPGLVSGAVDHLSARPLNSFGSGLIVIIGGPIAVVFLVITLIGIPVAVLLVLSIAVLTLASSVVAGYWIGLRARSFVSTSLKDPGFWGRVFWTVAGFIVLAAVGWVPVVGEVTVGILGAIAVGALLLALWDRFRGPAPVSPAI